MGILTEVCTKINNKLIATCRHLRRRLYVDWGLLVVVVLVVGLLSSNRTGAEPLSRALLHIVAVWKGEIKDIFIRIILWIKILTFMTIKY